MNHAKNWVWHILWSLPLVSRGGALLVSLFDRRHQSLSLVARVTMKPKLSRLLQKLVHPLSLTFIKPRFRSREPPQR